MKLYTDRKRIRAAIRAAQIKATTSVAAFRASVEVPYIRIKVAVGQFIARFSPTETVSIASVFKFVLSRGINDTYTVTDVPDIVPNKRPSDTVGTVDALDPFQIAKGLTENPKIEDSDYFAEDYTIYGYTVTSYEVELRKPVSEGVGVADLPDITPNKGLSDSVGAFDGILSKQFLAASSTVLTADITDVASSYLIRALNNTARLADVRTTVLDKPVVETPNVVESIVLKPILGIIDTPAVSDSGSLRMQDYCSFDYFAQDYVGTSLTF